MRLKKEQYCPGCLPRNPSERLVRPLPRYVLAVMAAFVAFELWIPLLAIVIRALVGPTIPTAVQAVVPLFGLAVPAVVGLALSDYLADRQGLVRPYQPKRRPADLDQEDERDEENPAEGRGGERTARRSHRRS